MKKIIASAVGLMLVGGVASTAFAAIDTQIGGYWRTRFIYEDNFTGKNTAAREYVDTRTHLYLTTKFSDDFKFVNKFELNTGWGDSDRVQVITNATPVDATKVVSVNATGLGAGGDLGADGKGNLRLKNSYADFNVGPMFNAKVGIQEFKIARGFIFNSDAAGVMLTGKFGNVTVPLAWVNASNEDTQAWEAAIGTMDQNFYAALAAVKINDQMSVTPYFVYHTITANETIKDSKNWYAGADADLKFGPITVWGTGIYNGGQVNDIDNKAFLGAVGVDQGLVHGQFFYASGDDNATDNENTAYVSAGLGTAPAREGASYYWSEIMGYGIMDNKAVSGTPMDDLSNIWAGNVGVTVKPMDKLKISADVWYAALAEDNKAGNTELGWEFDGVLNYKIYDNLSADVVLAYLLSGDVVGEEDVMEGGLRLSLSF